MESTTCAICGNQKGNKVFSAREMMFGIRENFRYLECGNCGCLSLIDIPADFSKYYPDNYYSFLKKDEDHMVNPSLSGRLKRSFKRFFLESWLRGRGLGNRILGKKLNSYYPWLKSGTLSQESSILDVGCGWGELLLKMHNDGFRNLTGVDPFIAEETRYKCGVIIYKAELHELKGKYDLIMMHHAFEHVADPLPVLKTCKNLLKEGGSILIRIPVADSAAWSKYGVDWVQLDAPRHIFLHTSKSMQLLASQAGLQLTDTVYDSSEFQFVGSEKYRRDIPLISEANIFDENEITRFREEAERLNNQGEGDQACFYLSLPK